MGLATLLTSYCSSSSASSLPGKTAAPEEKDDDDAMAALASSCVPVSACVVGLCGVKGREKYASRSSLRHRVTTSSSSSLAAASKQDF